MKWQFLTFCHEGVGHILTGLPPPPPCLILRDRPDEDDDDDEGDSTLGELARFFLGALAATATGAGGGVRTVKSPYCELLTFSGCNVMSFSAYHPLTLRWSSQKRSELRIWMPMGSTS